MECGGGEWCAGAGHVAGRRPAAVRAPPAFLTSLLPRAPSLLYLNRPWLMHRLATRILRGNQFERRQSLPALHVAISTIDFNYSS